MAASQSTTNYQLPIYTATDKPKYLTDFNGAMTKIDTQLKTIDDKTADGSEALETAEQANTTATQAKTTATQANEKATQNENVLASFFEGFTNWQNWTQEE